MRKIITEITIDAPADQVWQVLTDIAMYKEWNPFIVSSSGEVKKGSKLVNVIKNGNSNMTFKPMVTEVLPGKKFEWLGKLFIPGIFDGRHAFELIEESPNRTRFLHSEQFTGLFSGMILNKIKDDTKKGFEMMNEALKKRVEDA